MAGKGIGRADMGDRLALAALWWRGMGRAVLPMAPARGGIGWARTAIHPQAALVARSPAGRVIGLAGLRDVSGGLIDARTALTPALGRCRGSVARLGLILWRAGPATEDLVLDGLVVHPRARRHGVARALIRACLAEAVARGRPGLRVEVLAANRAALALYRAEGFAPIARHRPGHGRAALILRLPIPAARPIC